MSRSQLGGLTLLICLVLSGPARSQVSMTGLSGYFNTPSAQVLRDGSLEMGYNVFARRWSYDHRGVYSNNAYFATLGFLPRMEAMVRVTALPGYISYTESDSLSHLIAVARGARKPNGLSSLQNNVVVTEILEAARESARNHKVIVLPRQ